jgi:predicted TIM-barrel fold metal-dependent hydrolase
MKRLGVLAGLALALASPLAAHHEEAPALVDHHVHLLGPTLLADWKSLGVPFSREDAAYLEGTRYLAPGAATSALLLPMAHLYSGERFRAALGLTLEAERARVAAENDHVFGEAARLGTRAVAFCSIPLGRPYAWEEIRRCREVHDSPGLKLHFATAELDPRAPEALAEAARVAAWAEEEGVSLLVHFDPQLRGLEKSDVRRFAEVVLEPHPELEAVIAHLGGSGGYGEWTRTVLIAFAEWLESLAARGEASPQVYFDLSAVLLAAPSEGVPATTPEEAARLAPDLRRLGLARLLFGSDAPVFDPAGYRALLAERSGLTEAELAAICARALPALARAHAAGEKR